MTEREALKLALTALEDRTSLMKWQEARDAVKEVLAQPEREIDPSTTFDEVAKGLQVSRMAIAALDALTIEQRRSINEPLLKAQLFLKAAARVFKEALAQPEQEPVAVVNGAYANRIEWKCTPKFFPADGTNLYTTPPQRTWVGLTDEEIIKCTPTWGGTVEEVARAVEAKLKEKNT